MSQQSLPATKVGSGKPTQDTKKSATPIGADRYEEFITTTRARREGSQVMDKMIMILKQSKYAVNGFSFNVLKVKIRNPFLSILRQVNTHFF